MQKIGLALGSGSARGWAHIGVIRALTEMGIKPDIIAGCSVGAIVGAAYAMNEFDALEQWVRKLKVSQIIRMIDIDLFRGGLIKGSRLLNLIPFDIDVDIDSLTMPFATVATDINYGHEIWLQEGSLYQAIRASIALPGFFNPVLHNGHWLVDGGLVNPVPVSLCRAMGADRIIAVNLNKDIPGRHILKRQKKPGATARLFNSFYKKGKSILPSLELFSKNGVEEDELDESAKKAENNDAKAASPLGYFDVIASSINIMQYRITNSRLAGDAPDVIIEPLLAHMDLIDFDKADEAIKEGYESVKRSKVMLKHCLYSHD